MFNSLGIPIVQPAPKRPKPLVSSAVPLDFGPIDYAQQSARDECAHDVDGLCIQSLENQPLPTELEHESRDDNPDAAAQPDNGSQHDLSNEEADQQYDSHPDDYGEDEEEGAGDSGSGESDFDDEDDLLDVDVENTQEEIEELEGLIPGLASHYRLLGKIGEGTFSTVYKAIDLQHERYDNSSWTMIFNADSFDDLSDHHSKPRARRRTKTSAPSRRARVVAIKKIYVTSSPARIANEISILNDLKDSRYIAPLVTAMRKEDQVVVVLPYFPNDDFRQFYLDLPVEDMRWYFASLFSALAYAHSKGVMHRDIKPSNFLYDTKRRHGVLVDFGLAEREGDQEAVKYRSRHSLQMDASTAMRLFRSFDQKGRPGIPRKDTRPGLRANRAGTRGFRAPEVLLKIPQQTVSIDIWSVGVIMLCFLTRRFPFFQSTDDTEALLEIAVLYGRLEMERAAVALGRSFLTNIPTVKDRGIRFESLAKAYNAEGFASLPSDVFDLLRRLLTLDPESRITAEQALEHPFVAQRKV
ncbi:Cell division control protein 7 [Coemansia thaxteri]|uniref:non-specific serine/threonine protein kinase n=1 Tax=Coemansia thaxteri TaxID=2663907 RepID=A0A9W8EK25_9FUNG|nr:Cell division control protein 7 [Coemansia thaxteri]KAJ2009460.1 Cell division control protein 7 [Coemansia thaxteri]KAJ2474091.1 Cell division control protein 7 [Coemansia sp. RSA 2322]KAJ2486359.1 Cell division control protein 7 [Coemansia sp. RSA 2320]